MLTFTRPKSTSYPASYPVECCGSRSFDCAIEQYFPLRLVFWRLRTRRAATAYDFGNQSSTRPGAVTDFATSAGVGRCTLAMKVGQ